MNVRKFQQDNGVESAELIKFLRQTFPNFSKSALCMANNPKRYGVKLTAKAEKLLKEKYAPPKVEEEKPGRKVTLRLTEEEYNKIKEILKGGKQ